MRQIVSGRVVGIVAVTLVVLALLVGAFATVPALSRSSGSASHSGGLAAALVGPFHTITFTPAGVLPAGTTWWVTVNANFSSTSLTLANNSPAPIVFNLNASIAFGVYNWSAGVVPGFDTTPLAGQDNITTAVDTPHTITFARAAVHTVTFSETGLPATKVYGVTFNGASATGTAPGTIVFGAVNGSYSYSVSAPSGWVASISSGPIVVAGTTALTIAFFPNIGQTTIGAAFTNSFTIGSAPFFILPITVNFTITTTNATITAANLSATLTVKFGSLKPITDTFNGSMAASCNTGKTTCSFTDPISASRILKGFGKGAVTFPSGQYAFVLSAAVFNNNSPIGINTQSSVTIQDTSNLVPLPAFGQFSSPLGSAQAGTLTISGNYSGFYLTGATVTVLNASSKIVYTNGVFAPGLAVAFAVSWPASTPGTYTLVLTLVQQWGVSVNFTAAMTVTAAPTSVHSYTNNTWGIPGLGPGASAAIIVTLGVVIGMIVLALVGRGLWGGARPAAAQPWSGEKPVTPGAGGTFECSVCHQSFPSADALADHSKSQHGITT